MRINSISDILENSESILCQKHHYVHDAEVLAAELLLDNVGWGRLNIQKKGLTFM